jgi:hypothetical protein
MPEDKFEAQTNKVNEARKAVEAKRKPLVKISLRVSVLPLPEAKRKPCGQCPQG